MTDTVTIQMGKRGVMTMPKAWRETYSLQPGDHLTLLDLGGVFVLSPTYSQIDSLANQIASSLIEQGESLEDMLQALREERERYGTDS
ncbi:MAG: AbrB/MazE/SpoVT family DNA-binding domain-containing protein [Candidatus Promineifilaceae bacterium]|nr:AbrB/MazE/SpoVT family DNA-binding domain-containing protein [Candidatus Promineifilaceae bacterium]